MLRYILAFIPLVGTTVGAVLGTVDHLSSNFEKQEDTLVAAATGILCSIALNLFFEAYESIHWTLFIGVAIGFFLMLGLNSLAHKNNLSVRHKLFWAMLIHNVPEGMVIGISLADKNVLPATFSLVFSISLQNIPDGLVVSMPLVSKDGKKKAALFGIFSGVVEPIASILIIITAGRLSNIQAFEPLLIGFSLSAIIMIAIELLKECKNKKIVLITAIITTVFNGILG